jgi:outer membrane protein assembly factor BamA
MLRNKKNVPAPAESLNFYIVNLFSHHQLPFAQSFFSPARDSGTHITVDPGIVAGIRIDGNTKTSTALISRASGIHKGAILTQNLITKAIDALYSTDLFYNVNITFDRSHILHITVKEKEYWSARLGLRFDEYYSVEGYVEPAYENLFGAGISAVFHLQYGQMREKYAFELHTNTLFSRNWANNIGIQNYISRESVIDRKEYPDTLPDSTIVTKIDYDEVSLRKIGILAKLGLQIGRVSMIDGCIRFERFDISQSATSALQDPLGVSFHKGVRHLVVRFMVDDLDRFPFPSKGQKYYVSVGGAGAIIGGTEAFFHIRASLCHYFTLSGRHTISPQIMFAWADQSLPPVEKMYIGGALPEEKYRDIGVYNYIPFIGLRPRSIAGDIFALLHCSYRFSITRKLFLSAIADLGYAWNRNNTLNEPAFGFNWKTARVFFDRAPLGIGLSLAYETIIGPVKLSWGRVVRGSEFLKNFNVKEENRFYFSAGHDF